MSESFDPYHAWLGIPPKQQPPTHYRLLAIEPLESDPSVIESAADQRMAHLRTFQTGKRGALTQRLLNEVAAAKVCLLDPKKKAAYDAALRQQQAAEETDAVAADVFASADQTASGSSSVSATGAAKSKPNVAIIGGSVATVVLLVLVAAWVFLSGGKTTDEPQGVARNDVEQKQAAGDKGQSPKQDAEPPPASATSPTPPENPPQAADASAPSPPSAPDPQPVAAKPSAEQPPPSSQPAANENEAMESLLKAGRLSDNLLKPGGWQKGGHEWRLEREGNLFVFDNGSDSKAVGGALQILSFNPPIQGPIFAAAMSRADGVGQELGSDYSIFIDLQYADDTHLYGQNVAFDAGTHDWQRRELVIRPSKPVKQLSMNLFLRCRTGKAYFRDPELRVLKTADALAPAAVAKASGGQTAPAGAEEVKKRPIPSAEIQREIGATIEETYN